MLFLRQRRPSPSEAMMHFPPILDIPHIFKKFSDSVENFQNFTFSRKISRFSPAKISDDFVNFLIFLVIDHKFRISPLFSLFQYISLLVSRKLLFPPTLKNVPPVLEKLTCFLHTLESTCFSFPLYFDHDAFMHHPMHVLDASVIRPN